MTKNFQSKESISNGCIASGPALSLASTRYFSDYRRRRSDRRHHGSFSTRSRAGYPHASFATCYPIFNDSQLTGFGGTPTARAMCSTIDRLR